MNTTNGIVHTDFSGLLMFVARKNSRSTQIENSFVIHHETIPSKVVTNLNKEMKIMKLIKIVLFVIMLLGSILCWSQETPKKVSINIPTIEQEATSIWRTIKDIEFFEKQGYNINLPKNEIIDSLIIKSKHGTFGNLDYSSIYDLLELKIFNKSDYQLALENVREQEQLISKMILQLDSIKNFWNWDFKMYENYAVVFTLYGSGGSYDPATGTVTLFATKEGNFKLYTNPANTIIHEIVHIGIEESIAQQYNLPHALKERIVDKIVLLLFNDLLPEYKIQNMGGSHIDKYLKDEDDIKNLNIILKDYNE